MSPEPYELMAAFMLKFPFFRGLGLGVFFRSWYPRLYRLDVLVENIFIPLNATIQRNKVPKLKNRHFEFLNRSNELIIVVDT